MYSNQSITNISLNTPCRSKRTWTPEEQTLFKQLYKQYGKDFKRYVTHLDGRTEGQIKSFYQNVVHKNKQIQNSRSKFQIDNQISSNTNSQIVRCQNESSLGQNAISELLFESTTI
ncbi:Conserved_hypothetical protein [Hexamita inflata]|uniref:Uncharacterized protein n=1 Tax=Hexamita inflata TaxID=28002 RepID=A0AA86Q5X6_9EUKA|nr:Conserved hypothetical protein [Hexamita inflata]